MMDATTTARLCQIGADAARDQDDAAAWARIRAALASVERDEAATLPPDAFRIAQDACLRERNRSRMKASAAALAALPDPSTSPAWGDDPKGSASDAFKRRALRENDRPPSPDEVRFVERLGEPWLSHLLDVWRMPRPIRDGWRDRLAEEWRAHMRNR